MIAAMGRNTKMAVTALIWSMITMATARNRKWATRMSRSSTKQEGLLGIVPKTAYGLSWGCRQGAVAPELQDVIERVFSASRRPGRTD